MLDIGFQLAAGSMILYGNSIQGISIANEDPLGARDMTRSLIYKVKFISCNRTKFYISSYYIYYLFLVEHINIKPHGRKVLLGSFLR